MPFLHELENLQPGNDLYALWIEYALSFTKEDITDLIENGMTYQAEALRSMVREVIAGGISSPELNKKLDLIVIATKRQAGKVR